MKVSSKILIGYGALVLIMTFGIGYELWVLNRMQRVNDRLSEVNDAGLEVVELGENLRVVQEFTEKYLRVGEEYEQQLDQFRLEFGRTIELLESRVGTEGERRALDRLGQTWRDFESLFAQVRASRPPGTHAFVPVRLEELLGQMTSQIERVDDEIRRAFLTEVSLASAARESAHWVAWGVAVAAVVMAGGIGLSMTRSIGGSFQRFMAATASLAEGNLDRRISESQPDEFGALATSFNAMARKLEEVDRLKKDFVSSVSHELKSPIASSREIVQLLLEEIPGPLNDEQRRLLELSVRSSRRLSAMVGGLLDLARMDAGTMRYDMERSDIRELVESTLEEARVLADDRGLEIEASLGPVGPVLCDRDRIVQVITNLVDNAMKFSSRGSLIAVRLEAIADGGDPPTGGAVMFSIIDRGPGVPDGYKKRVFAKFQQVRQPGAQHQGVGLGLAICRSIIEAHHGQIWVEDNPQGGAVFRFVLPSGAANPRSPEPARAMEA